MNDFNNDKNNNDSYNPNVTIMKDCFVAFLDILGFSDMVGKHELEDQILGIFDTVSDKEFLRETLNRSMGSRTEDEENDILEIRNEALDAISIYLMSDSVVLSIPTGYKNALETMIEVCMLIQSLLLSTDPPIMIRGAIAKGDFFTNDRIAFGVAMVEAYRFQEYYSKYPRIIITSILVDKILDSDFKKRALQKDKNDDFYYLDTMKTHFLDVLPEDSLIKKFREFIDMNLSHFSSQSVREKYIWLDKELKRIEGLIRYKYQRKNELESWFDADNGKVIDDDSLKTIF